MKFRYTCVKEKSIFSKIFSIEEIESGQSFTWIINNAVNSGVLHREMSIGLPDKNGVEMFVGDIVQGYRGYMTGDGRLRKSFPDKVRIWLEIFLSDGKSWEAGFQLKEIKYHPDDQKFVNEKQYRSILYRLNESCEQELKDNEFVWLGKCNSLEVIGNKYHNPELLKI